MTEAETDTSAPDVILASASRSRARLLEQVGIVFTIEPARVDEETVKNAMLSESARHNHIAETLAEIKSMRISTRHPRALVIGADQVLSAGDKLYNKPESLAEAREQLLQLAGRKHQLHTAVCVALGGKVIWRYLDSAGLQMRTFSDRFVDDYLKALGDDALSTVGCYQLEGRGPQLFNRISGDYYAILGLPLLPLLAFLRNHKVVAT